MKKARLGTQVEPRNRNARLGTQVETLNVNACLGTQVETRNVNFCLGTQVKTRMVRLGTQRMACRGFWECLLKLLNFLLILVGLAMIGYGVYLFVEYKNGASIDDDTPITPSSGEFLQLGRPMLLAVSLGDSIFDKLPKAWFIYLFTGVGIVVLFIACCGCIGTSIRNGCCLTCVNSNVDLVLKNVPIILKLLHLGSKMRRMSILHFSLCYVFFTRMIGFLKLIKYSVLLILLILLELGTAAFIFFDKSWKEKIPTDKTGNFDQIYEFLEKHWNIIKWVTLGAVILEALIFLLALVVRAANTPADYDSDDEYIGGPRQQIRQPLVNRPAAPAAGVPVAGALDQRPSRNDAWSARMREKYGLDTSEFTYNPSESNRYPQTATQPAEEKSRCIIM
ncbi:hypothetical protein BUALT_Bualt10G0016500 [Buddleja alternifolia]|uniref:Tobamovirus multiplication protein 2A n=1 Tax=Buddleja alternifolia TaxID=168488 RepID=A0AAV6X5Z7_9LAMI|nr:hypothetical protein BUALT_Bualt10G0016500 [Buddleja alternifolia]